MVELAGGVTVVFEVEGREVVEALARDALLREVLEAGDSAWDRAWPMPMWREYQDAFKSNIADFANAGPHGDSAITAACFLSRFTGRYPWVHLDVAGTAYSESDLVVMPKGPTGTPMGTFVAFVRARAS